jgi:phospho-N-acetylmuramoyl-pentapeptide-transferase
VKTILVSAGVSMVLALFGTPLAIRIFRSRGYGQVIREEGSVPAHQTKRGTPSMGGTVIVVATLVGYLAGHELTKEPMTWSGVLVLFLMTGLGAVGFIDDFLKIWRQTSTGLRSGAKLAGQAIVGAVFAVEVLRHPDSFDLTPADAHISFLHDVGPAIGVLPFVLWVVLMISGFSNAVNLTDGLDGLAAGSSTFCFAVLGIMGYWIFRHESIYHVLPASAIDLALGAVALAGACLGFLWWNAAPAQIIMGDTGSQALGSGLAALCLLMNLDLLLPILGGLFVLETLSVIAQVISFRVFGRRIFRMAPIHHHFELLGWPETTVIVRFWILGGLFAALALGIFYGEFLTVAKIAT